jgi:hypothetical protein
MMIIMLLTRARHWSLSSDKSTILILCSQLRLTLLSNIQMFLPNPIYTLLPLTRATFTAYLNLLDMIILVMLGEEYEF